LSKFDSYPVKRLFLDRPATAPRNFSLHVDAGSSLSEVFIIDPAFNLVARGQGSLQAVLPEGEYLIKYRAGDTLKEEWVTLNADKTVSGSEAPLPPTAAPISERVGWSSADSEFAESLRPLPVSIVIRDPQGKPSAFDVRILDRDGNPIAGLPDPPAGWTKGSASNVIGFGGGVAPGGYLLAVYTPGLRPYAMPIWVAPNCSTQVFLEQRQLDSRVKSRLGPHLASASIFISKTEIPWEAMKRLLQLTEAAKSVLRYDRPILPSQSEIHESLDEKFLCPRLGLLAGHLLRLRYEELKAKPDSENAAADVLKEMKTVVRNLSRLIPRSPDVGALELAVGQPSQADFGVPPMLAHSWAILEQLGASLIPPDSYADRIRTAICATRPWLVFNKSKMIPRVARRRKKTVSGTSSIMPAAQAQAIQQASKHFLVSVNPDGSTSVKRK
jgi:hypothetical protein